MWPVWGPNWATSLGKGRPTRERVQVVRGAGRVDSRRWRRRLRRQLRRAGEALSTDAESFLSGRLAERLAGRTGSVPAWTWTNLLAHGTEADLRAEAKRATAGPAQGERRWRQARAYLAVEVLKEAGARGSLTCLQKEVLVPLELDLAARAEVIACWPAQWVAAVERALRQRHRAGCQ